MAKAASETEIGGLPIGPGRHSTDLVVPADGARFVVGHGGLHLRYLSRRLGVQLTMLPAPLPEGRDLVVRIEGESPTTVEVAELELARVATEPRTFLAEVRAHVQQRVHVFVDGWNAHIHPTHEVSPERLARLVVRDRRVGKRVVCASVRANCPVPALWEAWGAMDYRVHLEERAPGARERGVDDRLHAAMLQTVSQFNPPEVLVLVTGDGGDNDDCTTFPTVIEAALRSGWNVEVYAWRHSCSGRLRALETHYAETGQFQLFFLDVYAPELLDRPHGRRTAPASTTARAATAARADPSRRSPPALTAARATDPSHRTPPSTAVHAATAAAMRASRPSNYKTKLCRNFLATGECRYGERCFFAHGEGELRGGVSTGSDSMGQRALAAQQATAAVEADALREEAAAARAAAANANAARAHAERTADDTVAAMRAELEAERETAATSAAASAAALTAAPAAGEDQLCCVCLENARSHMPPCGHRCVCEGCTRGLAACPMCRRGPISHRDWRRVFT